MRCGICLGEMEANRCESCGLRIITDHLDAAIAALDRAKLAGQAHLYRADGRIVRIRQQRAAIQRLRNELELK